MADDIEAGKGPTFLTNGADLRRLPQITIILTAMLTIVKPVANSASPRSTGWTDDLADEPEMIATRDGGQHWQRVSQQFLQSMQFVDDSHGYGTLAEKFFRTNDGGRSWVGTKIPDIHFIDRMIFLTPDDGWIAGVDGKDFFVFRTVNGGRDWEQSRTTPQQTGTGA